jgi:hypothetical protein
MQQATYYREELERARRLGDEHPAASSPRSLRRLSRDFQEIADGLEAGAIEVKLIRTGRGGGGLIEAVSPSREPRARKVGK